MISLHKIQKAQYNTDVAPEEGSRAALILDSQQASSLGIQQAHAYYRIYICSVGYRDLRKSD